MFQLVNLQRVTKVFQIFPNPKKKKLIVSTRAKLRFFLGNPVTKTQLRHQNPFGFGLYPNFRWRFEQSWGLWSAPEFISPVGLYQLGFSHLQLLWNLKIWSPKVNFHLPWLITIFLLAQWTWKRGYLHFPYLRQTQLYVQYIYYTYCIWISISIYVYMYVCK